MDAINDIRICALPDMRVLVSIQDSDQREAVDQMGQGMQAWAEERGIHGFAGMRENWAYFDEINSAFIFMRRIPDGFLNDGPYRDQILRSGLEGVISGERDHLVARYSALMEWIAASDRYELDIVDGAQRHPALLDWLTPLDIHDRFDFEQQDIFVPIRLRK
jgi:hypothetical protein